MKQCAICGKGSIVRGARKKLRGKYNLTVKKRKYPNLQWTRLPARHASQGEAGGPKGKQVLACARCIKAFSKRAIV